MLNVIAAELLPTNDVIHGAKPPKTIEGGLGWTHCCRGVHNDRVVKVNPETHSLFPVQAFHIDRLEFCCGKGELEEVRVLGHGFIPDVATIWVEVAVIQSKNASAEVCRYLSQKK